MKDRCKNLPRDCNNTIDDMFAAQSIINQIEMGCISSRFTFAYIVTIMNTIIFIRSTYLGPYIITAILIKNCNHGLIMAD